MQLSIHTRSVEITDTLRDLISRRLHFALDVFQDRVSQASVYLADINGPRGGVDKSCHITVEIRGIGQILARAQATSTEAALTHASRRLKYLVSEAVRQAGRPDTESIRRMSTAA
jgi:ribosome-associated translation inhibitor RaiA